MAETHSTIGPFVLFKETESDELGRLYRAGEVNKEGWRRTVWLRVLQAPGIQPEALAEREAIVNELSGQLKAANVVSGQEFHIIDGLPVLVWDHVPGHLLSRLLAKTREEGFPVPTDNALLIIEKLALALSAGLAFELEGQSMIHGFLHPGMVMVTNEGEALVAGFGLAEQLLGVLDDPSARERCAPYLAPEVLQARSTTKRADVYSLGAILYELLTGGPLPADPAARPAAVENARMALEDEPVPEDIAVLLRRSLAARPEERFSSAADFKKELDKLLFGGNYSPTTFNLALFIDRLFRADIEREEKEQLTESEIDPAPYIAPEPEEEEEELAVAKARSRAGMWIALAAALVLVAVALVVLAPRLRQPPIPPTPTPEELAAKKAAEQKRFEALVQEELQRLMAEKEAQTQKELEQRQKEIEALQKKLKTVQKPKGQQTLTAEQKRKEEALRKQIAEAEAAKKEQEAKLEAARQKALEEARRKAEAKAAQQQKPTPVPTTAPTGPAALQPTAPPKVANAAPTAAAAAEKPTAGPAAVQQITEGMYVPPTEVDTIPAVLRTEPPRWTRMALNSRRRGVVILSARVDAKGRVTSVRVLRADDKGFGIPESASDAVKKYRFKPATKNGVKVSSDVTVAIPYSFRSR